MQVNQIGSRECVLTTSLIQPDCISLILYSDGIGVILKPLHKGLYLHIAFSIHPHLNYEWLPSLLQDVEKYILGKLATENAFGV
jgi:hypothetical protein